MPPLTVMIKPVSGLCNMRCRYCFYADETAHRSTTNCSPMKLQTLETTIRRVIAYADQHVTFIFQGGEPTLAGVAFFQEVIRLQRRYNGRSLPIENIVQTNGLYLSDEMLALFSQHDFLLGLSIDGTEKTHNAFRKDAADQPTYRQILNTAEKLNSHHIRYNILCVVTNETALHAAEVLDALAGFRYLQFIPCLDPLDGVNTLCTLTPDAYAAFLDTAFSRYEQAFHQGKPISIRFFDNLIDMLCGRQPESCAMNGHCSVSMVVESDGSVYPCDFYALDEWNLGNIADVPLRKMLQCDNASLFIKRSLKIPEKCAACPWYKLCRNGCYRERDPYTGICRWCEVMQSFFSKHFAQLDGIAKSVMRYYNRL